MKNTEKDIIERFQKFDFDPDEKKQKEIFEKLADSTSKKRTKRFSFVFATAFSVIAVVFLVNNYPDKGRIGLLKGNNKQIESSVSSDNIADIAPALTAGEAVAIPQYKEEKTAEALPSAPKEKVKEKPSLRQTGDIAPAPEYSVSDGAATVASGAQLGYSAAPASKAQYEEEAVTLKNYASVSKKEESRLQLSYNERSKGSSYKRSDVTAENMADRSQPRQQRLIEGSAVKRSSRKSENFAMSEASVPAGAALNYRIQPDYNAVQDESYKKYEENSFRSTASDPLSTFSADVDMASYNIVRQVIMAGRKPNPDSVRIEEFLNYFDYSYPQPEGSDPVSMNFEYTDSPWNNGLKLVKIGVKAKDIEKADLPPSNLVFLIDVSGSMEQQNRLPLVKKSMRMLVDELRPEDRVSIVTYANGVRELLSGAKGSEKEKIINIIESLNASGGTSGSEGLKIAYETAKKNFIRKGNNRVILATDGDFNIGPRSESELENQITEARGSGVFLSVLGFGMGNYKDSKVQTLANKGNGNYAYINDLFEARKTLVKEFGATLFTVAKDVKLQVEFNPSLVSAYRLIGYEKRALATQDFNDDAKDAGEMGAGHTVTVIYEIIPAGVDSKYMPDVEKLKYTKSANAGENDDLLTLKLRYKEPDSDKSRLMEKALKQKDYVPFNNASDDMRFAASVAQFGQIVKDSQYKGNMTIDEVISTAKKSKGADEEGYRTDFVKMAEMYKMISNDNYAR